MHVLVLVCVPPPQLFEHVDQSPNTVHPPSTGEFNQLEYERMGWRSPVSEQLYTPIDCENLGQE